MQVIVWMKVYSLTSFKPGHGPLPRCISDVLKAHIARLFFRKVMMKILLLRHHHHWIIVSVTALFRWFHKCFTVSAALITSTGCWWYQWIVTLTTFQWITCWCCHFCTTFNNNNNNLERKLEKCLFHSTQLVNLRSRWLFY